MTFKEVIDLILILLCIYVVTHVTYLVMVSRFGKQYRPTIIVLEGLDGAGKKTVSTAITTELNKEDPFNAMMISFPMYGKWHCRLVEWYLNGKFGKDPTKVSPYISTLFYAIDRYFGMRKAMYQARMLNVEYIILDRYVTSNTVFQVAKAKTWKKAKRIDKFIQFIEHGLFRLPHPDYVILLTTPVKNSIKNMENRETLDIHETNTEYLTDAGKTMLAMAEKHKWIKMPVFKPGTEEFRTPEDIAKEIIKNVNGIILILSEGKNKS